MKLCDKMVAHLIAVTLNITETFMAAIDSLWWCFCLLREVLENFVTAFDIVSATCINAPRAPDHSAVRRTASDKELPRRYRISGLGVTHVVFVDHATMHNSEIGAPFVPPQMGPQVHRVHAREILIKSFEQSMHIRTDLELLNEMMEDVMAMRKRE